MWAATETKHSSPGHSTLPAKPRLLHHVHFGQDRTGALRPPRPSSASAEEVVWLLRLEIMSCLLVFPVWLVLTHGKG